MAESTRILANAVVKITVDDSEFKNKLSTIKSTIEASKDLYKIVLPVKLGDIEKLKDELSAMIKSLQSQADTQPVIIKTQMDNSVGGGGGTVGGGGRRRGRSRSASNPVASGNAQPGGGSTNSITLYDDGIIEGEFTTVHGGGASTIRPQSANAMTHQLRSSPETRLATTSGALASYTGNQVYATTVGIGGGGAGTPAGGGGGVPAGPGPGGGGGPGPVPVGGGGGGARPAGRSVGGFMSRLNWGRMGVYAVLGGADALMTYQESEANFQMKMATGMTLRDQADAQYGFREEMRGAGFGAGGLAVEGRNAFDRFFGLGTPQEGKIIGAMEDRNTQRIELGIGNVLSKQAKGYSLASASAGADSRIRFEADLKLKKLGMEEDARKRNEANKKLIPAEIDTGDLRSELTTAQVLETLFVNNPASPYPESIKNLFRSKKNQAYKNLVEANSQNDTRKGLLKDEEIRFKEETAQNNVTIASLQKEHNRKVGIAGFELKGQQAVAMVHADATPFDSDNFIGQKAEITAFKYQAAATLANTSPELFAQQKATFAAQLQGMQNDMTRISPYAWAMEKPTYVDTDAIHAAQGGAAEELKKIVDLIGETNKYLSEIKSAGDVVGP